MYPIERRKAILEILEQRTSASVEELAKLLYTGAATVRRDLDKMAKEGIINRTHGGAVKIITENVETPYDMRAGENATVKERIAEYAAEMIKDGTAVFLDSSSTVVKMVRHLALKKNIKVVTNGVNTSAELAKNGMNAVCTGGIITGASGSFTGGEACRSASRYNADLFFYSCHGFTADKGATESSEEVASVKERMAEGAKKRILLVSQNKIGKTALCKHSFVPDIIITDGSFSAEERAKIEEKGTKILLV